MNRHPKAVYGSAFIGFRHDRILSLYRRPVQHDRLRLVGACEADLDAAGRIRREGLVTLTHDKLQDLLTDPACDIIAVGDYYQARGRIVIDALQSGKHVIADKPLCTS